MQEADEEFGTDSESLESPDGSPSLSPQTVRAFDHLKYSSKHFCPSRLASPSCVFSSDRPAIGHIIVHLLDQSAQSVNS